VTLFVDADHPSALELPAAPALHLVRRRHAAVR